jgi:fatty acid desaturase
VLNTLAMVAAYGAIGILVGPALLVTVAALPLIIAFCIEDVLLVSQHSHIPMQLSGGAPVHPFPTLEQEPFTRSMRLPAWLSRCALHFDAHELHHMYPAVPGYHLSAVPYTPMNEVPWWRWVPAARAVPGEVLLFQNRHESGLDV